MSHLSENRRWYKRQNCDFPMEVAKPVSLTGRVVNFSDGGLLIAMFPKDQNVELEVNAEIELLITVSGPSHLSTCKRVNGIVKRVSYDSQEHIWYVGIEVIGPWEDIY